MSLNRWPTPEELSRFTGIKLEFFSKGTTSLVFTGKLESGRKVILKIQRPDSPRANLLREFRITSFLSTLKVSPRPLRYGVFNGLEFMIREFAEGIELRKAIKMVNGGHVLSMMFKALTMDRVGLDHGQIQGGKHIIVGDDVFIIDFEKADFRKPKNLTALISMLFLGNNSIATALSEKFDLNEEFRRRLIREIRTYKYSGDFRGVFELIRESVLSS